MSALIKLSGSKEDTSIRYYASKYYLVFILIVFLVVILLANFIRNEAKNGALIEEESYFYARISNNFTQLYGDGIDNMNYGGRNVSYGIGFPLVISTISKFTRFSITFLIKYLSIILGLLILLALFLIMKKLHLEWRIIGLTLFFMAISPTFIYFSNFTSPVLFAILLSLLSYYLFISDSRKISMFSSIPLALTMFFDFYIAIFSLLFLILITYIKRKNKIKILMLDIAITLFVFMMYYNII